MTAKPLAYLVRLGISLAIFGLLITALDLQEIGALFKNIDVVWVLISFSFLVALRMLMMVRWQILLQAHDINVPIFTIFKITMISAPMGPILPAGLGIDLVRGYEVSKYSGKLKETALTLLEDRIVGVYSMIALATVMAVVAEAIGQSTGLLWIVLGAHVGFIAVVYGFAYHSRSLQSLLLKRLPSKIADKTGKIIEALLDMRSIREKIISLIVISVAIQVFRALMYFALYKSVGFAAPLSYYFVYIPIVLLIIMIPISIGGLGLREAGLVAFFTPLGIASEVSITAGIMAHVIEIAFALPGLVWFMLPQKRLPKAHDPNR